MKTLLLTAHPAEAKALAAVFPNCRKVAGKGFYETQNVEIHSIGQGKQGVSTLGSLDIQRFHSLVFFGAAGALTPKIDFGRCFLGYPVGCYGQVSMVPTLELNLPRNSLITVETPVMESPARLALHQQSGAGLVDMEGGYFAEFARQQNLPWAVVRVVSDTFADHWEFPLSPSFRKSLETGAQRLLKSLEALPPCE